MRKITVTCAGLMLTAGAFAFQPIPKESATALGMTRGRPFSAGMAFVNGKYIEPPYTVERWGTGIRINQIPVTGQLINWNKFLKTQPGVKIEKKDTVPEPTTPEPTPEPGPEPAPSVANEMDSLDALFDDDPAPSAKPAAKPAAKAVSKAVPKPAAKPAAKPAVNYVLSGAFKPNDASKTMLKRINSVRTDIDRILRADGFIFFGDNQAWVSGDKQALMAMLEKLPELLQNSRDVDSFLAGVRAANLVYLNEPLCRGLFKYRFEYRKLRARRERYKSDQRWSRMLEDAVDPVF